MQVLVNDLKDKIAKCRAICLRHAYQAPETLCDTFLFYFTDLKIVLYLADVAFRVIVVSLIGLIISVAIYEVPLGKLETSFGRSRTLNRTDSGSYYSTQPSHTWTLLYRPVDRSIPGAF